MDSFEFPSYFWTYFYRIDDTGYFKTFLGYGEAKSSRGISQSQSDSNDSNGSNESNDNNASVGSDGNGHLNDEKNMKPDDATTGSDATKNHVTNAAGTNETLANGYGL
jgi:hypothetical protein